MGDDRRVRIEVAIEHGNDDRLPPPAVLSRCATMVVADEPFTH
jgi:hypothetical protein